MTTFTWDNVLSDIRDGKQPIPTAPNGIPVVAVNAPFYELTQLMEAITTGYNGLVCRAAADQKKIERIRKLAEAHFPADRKAEADGWISVEDMLPPETGYYLTYDFDSPVMGVYAYAYSAKYQMFNTRDYQSEDEAAKTAIHVTHWHKCPMPPKRRD